MTLNHRVGMPTIHKPNHPTGMEYSRPTTIGLECPNTYTYNNNYYGSSHLIRWNTPGPSTIGLECQPTMSPIILPGWNTPGPQPSGWNAPLPIHTVTTSTTTSTMGPIIPRDGIPQAPQPSGWNANLHYQTCIHNRQPHNTLQNQHTRALSSYRDGIPSTIAQTCAHITSNLLPVYRQSDQLQATKHSHIQSTRMPIKPAILAYNNPF